MSERSYAQIPKECIQEMYSVKEDDEQFCKVFLLASVP